MLSRLSVGCLCKSVLIPLQSDFIRVAMLVFTLLATAIPLETSAAGGKVASDAGCLTPGGNTTVIKTDLVDEQFSFSGLASYLNGVTIYVVSSTGITLVDIPTSFPIHEQQQLAIVGRFKIQVIETPSATASVTEQGVVVVACQSGAPAPKISEMWKSSPDVKKGDLNQLRYAHLWKPLAYLSRGIEFVFVTLFGIVGSWGLSIIIFAVVMRLLFIPVAAAHLRAQSKVDSIHQEVEPLLKSIKQEYDGEEAHEKILGVYKNAGVTPFFTLRPLAFPLIQVPVLVAVFNALGEMSQLKGIPFLWISDLAYPDSISRLPFDLPIFGSDLNALPVLMTIFTVAAALLFKTATGSKDRVRREKRNFYLMAAFFFVLFYAFPAAMVLYWTATNLLQVGQQLVMSHAKN